jgi:hypothetical protein
MSHMCFENWENYLDLDRRENSGKPEVTVLSTVVLQLHSELYIYRRHSVWHRAVPTGLGPGTPRLITQDESYWRL